MAFTKNDYELVTRDILYQGFYTLVRNHLRHRRFNGDWTGTFSREILERKSAAGILLYDPDLDRVVLIEQFRAGALQHDESPWLIEIVAGVYDPPETPDEVASRESLEEAGAKVLAIEPIYGYFVSPGGSNEFIHLFIGKINSQNIDGIYGLPEEHEDIRAFTLSRTEAIQLLKKGTSLSAPAIITLQWLQLEYEGLRKRWLTK